MENRKNVTSKGGKRRRFPRSFGYIPRVEQLEDRLVPSGNTKVFPDFGPLQVVAGATTTTLTASNAAPVYGTAITLTATVAPASGTTVPTQGSVAFVINGGASLGAGTFTGSDANHDALFTYVTTATQLQVDSGLAQPIKAIYTAGPGFTGSTSANLAVTVTPAPLTVTGVKAQDKAYDATTTAGLDTGSAAMAGVVSGDTVTLNTANATGTFASKDVANGVTVTVSGLMLAGAQANDYALTQPTTTANITPAPLTVTGITAGNKVYDATSAATLNAGGAALAGVFSGDTVMLNTAGATGAFASKDAGTGIPVTVSGLTIAGAQAGDYALTQPATTASITPAALTVTGITANTKVYDATTKAALNTASAALNGVISGDAVTLSLAGATGTFASKDVGTGIPVAVSGLTISGAQALDYKFTQPTAVANIMTATLTVGGITAGNKTYDATAKAILNASSASLAGVYSGDTVTLITAGATGTFASKDVGTGIPVSVSGLTLGGAQATDYTLTQPATTANITPAALALTVTGVTAGNKVYDGSTKATLTTGSAVLAGVISGDTVTLNMAGATGTFATKDVGTGILVTVSGLTLGGAQGGDYTLAQPTTTANITPAPLTVTGITAGNKVYDATTKATLNTGSAALAGLFGGDAVTLNTASAIGTFANKDVGGGVQVTVSGLTTGGTQAGDYTLAQPKTTANITPVTLTVTGITAGNKVYDATTKTTLNMANAALAGVISGDTVLLNTAHASGSFAGKDVANGITVSMSGLTLGGAQAADYTLTQPTTTANITPAVLAVTGITAKNKTYDATTKATLDVSSASLAGLYLGDMVTLSTAGAAGTFMSKDVGAAIPVRVTGLSLSGAQAGDYTLTQPMTAAKIAPADLTVGASTGVTGITANDKVYDATTKATLNTSNASLVGVFAGDTVILGTAGATGTFASKDVGTGITVAVSGLTLGGAQAGDYTLTQPTTTANITPATLTVSGITANNKVYDATTKATLNTGGAALVGVFAGDTVTLNTAGATGTFASKDVGNAITVTVSGLTISGPQASDYTLTQPTTTANITPLNLTVGGSTGVTGITANNKVYDATTKATLNTANAVLVGVISGDTVTLNTAGATGTFASKDVGNGITVTVSGLTLGGAQAADYTLTQPMTTANITPATLTVSGITAGNKVYDATTKATLNTAGAALVGVFAGDTVTLSAAGATGTFASKDVGNAITVTVSGLTISGPQAGDYTLTQPTTTANITPANLTVGGSTGVTGITANNKVYDTTTKATLNTGNATLVGVFTGDTVTLNTAGATGTFASKDVGTGIMVTVSGLTLGGAQAFDYMLTQPTTTANITPATLTVSGITANSKVYDATTKAALNTGGAALVGVFAGDTVTLNTAGATGTFASKDVGNGITVTVSGLTLGGAQAADYTLTQPTTTANITPATLTVSGITANNKVYDGTTKAALNTGGAALVGVFAGDTVTLNMAGATGTFASKDVGNGITVTVSGLTISGPQVGDYTLAQPTTTANITPATLTVGGSTGVTGITANNKVYDATTKATLNTSNAALVGVISGDTVTLNMAGATGTFASKDVGNGITVTVSGLTLGGAQAADYTLTQPTTTANITPATLTVSGITANNKVYDATTKATLNTSGAALVGVFAGDTVTLSTASATGTFASKDVGNAITVTVSGLTTSGPQAGDYTLTQPSTTANITPATLTVGGSTGVTGITANNKEYDATTKATLNTANAVLVGVLAGDTVTLNTAGATGTFASKDVGSSITVTVSGLTISGAQAADYTLAQPTTTANITPATLTVSGIAANSKVYDGTTKAALNTGGAALVGVFAGDTVTLNTTGATGTFASKDVGNGVMVTVSGLTLGGAQAGDYTLTQPSATANITPATLTVGGGAGATGITANDKVYDATTKATLNTANAVLVGVMSGDTVTLNTAGATGTFASKDMGNGITVTVSGLTISGAQAADYTLTQPATTANITPATLTVGGITASSKVYDATTKARLNTGGAALVGVFAGDIVNLNTAGATGTFASKDVGNGITVTVSGLMLGGAQAGDYTLTQPTTTANITPVTLTVGGSTGATGITANDKVYDATTKATLNTANAVLVGVMSGDTVTLNTAAATGTFASKDAGNGITVTVSGLTISGPQAGDYTLTQPTTTANITPATLTVTGVKANDKVYDATTKGTLSTAGAALVGVLSGDTVTLNAAGATGTFASQGVGNGIPVTISGLTLAGPQARDYTLVQAAPTTANITPDLMINPLFAKVGVPATITSTLLRADSASPPDTVVFTLVSIPNSGTISDGTTTLTANSTFTQADINSGLLTYTGTVLGPDSFLFSATDGKGGTVPISAFHIRVGPNITLPRVFVNPQSNLEGLSGLTAFVFQAKLLYGGSTYGPVTYDIYTTDGTAKAGVNYVGITAGDAAHGGTITFAQGSNITTVTVYVIAGSMPVTPGFSTATFTINVSDPSNPGVPLDSEIGTIVAQAATINPQFAEGKPAGVPGGVTLTSVAQLTPIIEAAEARWAQAGWPASNFQGIQFQITNLSNHVLANTDLFARMVSIDAGAAGFGWFVDPMPMNDYSFQPTPNSADLKAPPGSYAAGHMDLLTVMEHELGHFLGYHDLTAGPDTLMSQNLDAGMRRLPLGAPMVVWINPPHSPSWQSWPPSVNGTAWPGTNGDTGAMDNVFGESYTPWYSNNPENADPNARNQVFAALGSDQS